MAIGLDRLFVYGTLKRSFDHPMSKLLSRNADFIGEGRCPGRLYLIAHYPGLLRATDIGDVVFGELYRMHDPDALLDELDEYESCGPNFDPPTLYLRELLPVTLGDGEVQQAWTYIYNRPVVESTRIVSGRFSAK
jgi:gamma-glutamylcyclotransferase (GGCT)/AIG2-like uncharacterized protein YtfP